MLLFFDAFRPRFEPLIVMPVAFLCHRNNNISQWSWEPRLEICCWVLFMTNVFGSISMKKTAEYSFQQFIQFCHVFKQMLARSLFGTKTNSGCSCGQQILAFIGRMMIIDTSCFRQLEPISITEYFKSIGSLSFSFIQLSIWEVLYPHIQTQAIYIYMYMYMYVYMYNVYIYIYVYIYMTRPVTQQQTKMT